MTTTGAKVVHKFLGTCGAINAQIHNFLDLDIKVVRFAGELCRST